MGVGIDLCLDKEIPESRLRDTDGKTLADCAKSLDRICKRNGLKPTFSSFIIDPEAMGDDESQGEMMEEPWFESRDGLRVVTGLIAAIESPDGNARASIDKQGGVLTSLWRALGAKSGMEGKWAEVVLADLKELERCLKLAVEQGARFSLLAG